MRGLFGRVYAGLALVVVAALLLAGAWDFSRRRPPGAFLQSAVSAPTEVWRVFAEETDPAVAIRRLADELDADVTLPDPVEIPPPMRPRLARGLPASPPPGGPPDLWIPLDDGRVVRVRPSLRPPPVPLLAAALLIALGAVVAWQLLPLDRQLRALSEAATAFGAGRLSVRVRLPADTPVGELGARFDAMADRIARLVGAREELLQAVSHELRSPLQRVRFGVELLADAAPDERQRLLEGVHRDLDALDALVGELLDWERLDAEGPAKGSVALDALVRDLAGDRAGTLVPATVPGEERLLRRAIGNLLSNAARHARERVSVSVEVAGGQARVVVDDDGPGIPADQRERVLEPFVRLDAERTPGGVGLGLALVGRIARSHGGGVEIGDSPWGGARVALVLPLTIADAG